MSLLFSRISKLPACRVNSSARFFSSLPESPYLLMSEKALGETSEGGTIVTHKVFDPRTEETVNGSEKTFPKELERDALVGASQAWVVCMDKKDSSLHLTDLYKPWVSSPRVMLIHTVAIRLLLR